MGKHEKDKTRDSIIDYATGGGSGSATRARHPELQRTMNAINANNAFASKKYGSSHSSSHKKREFVLEELD